MVVASQRQIAGFVRFAVCGCRTCAGEGHAGGSGREQGGSKSRVSFELK